ncbi:MAG: 4-hydroxythreonine-4-phosphate dehydrogenase PdxA [Nitrospinae bacterium]|nr:4-hydroxythreonine-4-phosphate dehydrogenase PdxA [Nitrospinota bacterium]
MGDPAGIGPEIVAKAFANENLRKICRAAVVGDARLMKTAVSRYAPGVSARAVAKLEDARFEGAAMDVIDLRNVPENLAPGRPSAEGGNAAVEYIRAAADLALQRRVDAMVTAPINKEAIHLAGHRYPGQTELLAEYTGAEDFALMLAGRKLRVVLATTHIALKDVKTHLTRDKVLRTLLVTHRWLERHVDENPRIAVVGLNPHCGDGGIFGEEEADIIVPAIEDARQEGANVSGPFSADALFARARSGEYDAVVAMYHDQGMIPIKMESMGHAVNVALGLPIIRVSVDHGTAYDIAGKGIASAESLMEAVKAAASFVKSSLVHK